MTEIAERSVLGQLVGKAPVDAGNLVNEISGRIAELSALRRDLHAHPELSYQEFRTSSIVADRLTSYGIEVHRGIAGTGVVGVLKSGNSARAVGLRADMDALPILEANRFSHASTQRGTMHACGHDGHTVILLAAAEHLARTRNFDGNINFIFQPAEERGAGAQKMIDEGLFRDFPCEAVFGIHNWPGLPAGHFAVRSGPMMAGTAGFEIIVSGKGSHAAMPHLGIDPLLVACQIATSLQLLVSRGINPIETAVLSVTQIHAGETMNTLPDVAVLKGTVRAFSDAIFNEIEVGITRLTEQISGAYGASVAVSFVRNYPPTVNDEVQTRFAVAAMQSVVGPSNVDANAPLTLAAEDFSYMLKAKAGCYALLGNGLGDHRLLDHGMGPCTLHNSSYDFNDSLIPIGAAYWVRVAETFCPR